MALILPNSWPHKILSPVFIHPFWTSTVAVAPFPLSSADSNTTPVAEPFDTAFSSSTSDNKDIESNKLSTPVPSLADTSIKIFSPPHSSGITSCFVNSVLTFSTLAPSLSTLFTATIIGTPAAFECWMASMVWGLTPSSAATTKITISVQFAPRALIDVNAAWPGVSKNVSKPCFVSTW